MGAPAVLAVGHGATLPAVADVAAGHPGAWTWAQVDQPGSGGFGAAGFEVEGPQVLVEVDVQPFAAGRSSVLRCKRDHAGGYARAAGRLRASSCRSGTRDRSRR